MFVLFQVSTVQECKYRKMLRYSIPSWSSNKYIQITLRLGTLDFVINIFIDLTTFICLVHLVYRCTVFNDKSCDWMLCFEMLNSGRHISSATSSRCKVIFTAEKTSPHFIQLMANGLFCWSFLDSPHTCGDPLAFILVLLVFCSYMVYWLSHCTSVALFERVHRLIWER